MEIKIKIVLLMTKFESAMVVKRKWQSDFGKTTSTEHGIRIIFERFCEIGNVERSITVWKTSRNQSRKADEVNDFLQTHSGLSVQYVAEASSIPQTTIQLNIYY